MEKQTLPNSTGILVLGILSIVTCCCYGVIGLILGIVALVMVKKAANLYKEAPENYTGYSNVKAGKVLAIIGLVLNVLMLLYFVFIIVFIGMEGLQDPAVFEEMFK
jgi:hypothetical protein|tara:strand:- start:279 stop:596 length:318 start_codon:yes stop_codon:yes gene_type:complete